MNKRLIRNIVFFSVVLVFTLNACKKQKPPVKIDVKITYTEENNNQPKFWSLSENPEPERLKLYYYWEIPNGKKYTDPVCYPLFDFPGTYPIRLRITTSEGIKSYSEYVKYKVNQINPKLKENPYLHNLTIAADKSEKKKWVLSSADGHMSLGHSKSIKNSKNIDYKNDPIIEDTVFKADFLTQYGACAYSSVMEFSLNRYGYKNISKKWIVNWYFANNEFGYQQPEGEDICIDVSEHLDTTGNFALKENADGTVFIELNKVNFLPYYEGKPSNVKYQVLALYEDLLVIRKPYFDKTGNYAGYRMLRYVPEEKQKAPLPASYKMSITNPPHSY